MALDRETRVGKYHEGNLRYTRPMTYLFSSTLALLLSVEFALYSLTQINGEPANNRLFEFEKAFFHALTNVLNLTTFDVPKILLLILPFILSVTGYAAITSFMMELIKRSAGNFTEQLRITAYSIGTCFLCLAFMYLVSPGLRNIYSGSIEAYTILAFVVFCEVLLFRAIYRYLFLLKQRFEKNWTMTVGLFLTSSAAFCGFIVSAYQVASFIFPGFP